MGAETHATWADARRTRIGFVPCPAAGRPGNVLSVEQNAWSTVTIIPTSTSAQASVFRPEVVIAGRDNKILVDQVRAIDASYVAGELVDYPSRDDMAQVEHSLSRYLGLPR
jgi:mRNA interferase MazF